MADARRVLTALAVVVAVLTATGTALAFWTATTRAPGTAVAAVLGAGQAPTASVSGSTVTLVFPATAAPVGRTETSSVYRVLRHPATTAAPVPGSADCTTTGTTTRTCVLNGLPEGSWRFSVAPRYGTSWVGTFGGLSDVVTVDVTAPVVAVTAPAAASTTGRTPTLSGTAGTLAGDLAPVTVAVHAGSATSTAAVFTGTVAASGGAWSLAVGIPLAQGLHTVVATQRDASGNLGTSRTATWTVDATPPVPNITAPAQNQVLVSGSAVVQGTAGTAAGDLPTITLRLFTGTSTTPSQTVTATASGSTWSAGVSGLATGSYRLTATQSDGFGNTGTSTERAFSVLLPVGDTTAPSLTVTSPVTGTTYSKSQWMSTCSNQNGGVCGTATDPGLLSSGVASVGVTVQVTTGTTVRCYDGAAYVARPATGCPVLPASLTGSTWLYDLNFNRLTAGTFDLGVTARDAAGNATTTSRTFTYSG